MHARPTVRREAAIADEIQAAKALGRAAVGLEMRWVGALLQRGPVAEDFWSQGLDPADDDVP
jgi:hypothetical protein